MLMTVLMRDARRSLQDSGVCLSSGLHVHEILYADDTLLIEADEATAQRFMEAVADAGAVYGLSLNWSKVEALPVGCDCRILAPDGSAVSTKQQMVYLGSVLSADGKSGSEISRRLGAARSEFDKLLRVWKHSKIPALRKVAIFEACVMSKLLYNLHSLCMNEAEKRKVNAFQARCLRQTLKIPPSFYSRASNQTVLE